MNIDKLQKARKQSEHAQTDERYRPRFHASVPFGWLNDPNGFCQYRGAYHLFYQHNPYDTLWGPMYWGHFVSEDLLRWRSLPIALAPDTPYDAEGCWSGTATVQDGQLCLLYTGLSRNQNAQTIQQQCLAYSSDGIDFQKEPGNPVIRAQQLPPGADAREFRDPCVRVDANRWTATLAVKTEKGGQLLQYASGDLRRWRLQGVLIDRLGTMAECPDYFQLNGMDVIVVGLMGLDSKRFDRAQPVVSYIGHRDGEGKIVPEYAPQLLDAGLDFYAPQTTGLADGRRILIGWMHTWGNRSPLHTLRQGWNGVMTLPREVTLSAGGKLCQHPVRELALCREEEHTYACTVLGPEPLVLEAEGKPTMELAVELEKELNAEVTLMLMQSETSAVRLIWRGADLQLDRTDFGEPFTSETDRPAVNRCSAAVDGRRLQLQIIIDVITIEVFADDGETVMSLLAFPKEPHYGVSAVADGNARLLSYRGWSLVGNCKTILHIG